jgi:hypothetical protein
MYFHLGQRLVIHLVLEANQTKEKKPIWGVSINYKSHWKIFTNCKKIGDFEDANDQRYHNLGTWKWPSGEEITLGGIITNACSFC